MTDGLSKAKGTTGNGRDEGAAGTFSLTLYLVGVTENPPSVQLDGSFDVSVNEISPN